MQNKHQVHNLIILDESGSMNSIRNLIISGFNELVQSIKSVEKEYPEQEHLISFISFNSIGVKTHHYIESVSELSEINAENYRPAAMTPLFDAMGQGISKLRESLSGKTDFNVLVTVLTDGYENHSKEYKRSDIKALIEELEKVNWTFTYIGADHDVSSVADSLSIKNTMQFEKNDDDIRRMFLEERSSRAAYSRKICNKEDTQMDFYNDVE